MKNLNELSNAELIKLLQTTNKKLKRAEQTNKKLRKNVHILRRLNEVLSGISFYCNQYEDLTDLEFGKVRGRLELKEELMEIINGK